MVWFTCKTTKKTCNQHPVIKRQVTCKSPALQKSSGLSFNGGVLRLKDKRLAT